MIKELSPESKSALCRYRVFNFGIPKTLSDSFTASTIEFTDSHSGNAILESMNNGCDLFRNFPKIISASP